MHLDGHTCTYVLKKNTRADTDGYIHLDGCLYKYMLYIYRYYTGHQVKFARIRNIRDTSTRRRIYIYIYIPFIDSLTRTRTGRTRAFNCFFLKIVPKLPRFRNKHMTDFRYRYRSEFRERRYPF